LRNQSNKQNRQLISLLKRHVGGLFLDTAKITKAEAVLSLYHDFLNGTNTNQNKAKLNLGLTRLGLIHYTVHSLNISVISLVINVSVFPVFLIFHTYMS